ncbi:MAG: hypothetical protein LLG00_07985 [Planctomycetaceae bacterium]|nr:hypothetical protein [Planctomycetaceae bacterium]
MSGQRGMLMALALTAVLFGCPAAWAAPQGNAAAPAAADGTAKPKQPSAADKLVQEQKNLAERYKHLEDVLLRMAELSATNDPRRAALLKKAVAQSKEQLISVRFDQLVELLGKEQLSRALENQGDLEQDLRSLLELLMSENREKTVQAEKARIREYLKRINTLIKRQEDIQARTAGGDRAKPLADEQAKLADKTGDLAQDIRKNEEKTDGNGRKNGGRKQSQGGKKQGGDKKKDGEKSGEGKSGEEKRGDKKGDGSKGQGAKGSDDNAEGQQEQAANPARKRLESAQQRMKEAEEQLKQAQREGAAAKQEQAKKELADAKAELEKILRQLREEQIARVLAMLESRFAKMLQMQQEVYEGTLRLDRVPSADRTHNHEIESSRLSNKESQIVVEVDKASLLLHEDGSAVAMPEAVEQMRDDMQQIVSRLARAKVGTMTQGIEQDVIAALKEMVAALKKAQKDQGNKQKAGRGGGGGEPPEPPLVDALAELRMIRALQMRVNTRTARYSKMIEGEETDNMEVIESLRRLAERQQRIYRVTRDLQTGKNQ